MTPCHCQWPTEIGLSDDNFGQIISPSGHRSRRVKVSGRACSNGIIVVHIDFDMLMTNFAAKTTNFVNKIRFGPKICRQGSLMQPIVYRL